MNEKILGSWRPLLLGFILGVLATFGVGAIAQHIMTTSTKTDGTTALLPEQTSPRVFNTTEKNAVLNGNLVVATMMAENGSMDNGWVDAETTTASEISMRPYSFLGKPVFFGGRIVKVEEQPPREGMNGTWTEILLQSGNKNSPLGLSTIDFLYKGEARELTPGMKVWCAGYFVGTYESQNAMGGDVEGFSFVGNKIIPRKPRVTYYSEDEWNY